MGQKILNIIFGLAIIFLTIMVLKLKDRPATIISEPTKTLQPSGNYMIGHPFEGDPVIINR